METSLKYQARREVLQRVAPQYREATSSQKRTLLNAFVATTGYHRTYARWLLNHAEEVQQTHGRSQQHKYGPDVQPSMKLLSKERDGKKIRCVYDPAKTPLQRLLLSGILPAQKQQELTEVAQALDPVRLLHQLELLQQAVFRFCFRSGWVTRDLAQELCGIGENAQVRQ